MKKTPTLDYLRNLLSGTDVPDQIIEKIVYDYEAKDKLIRKLMGDRCKENNNSDPLDPNNEEW